VSRRKHRIEQEKDKVSTREKHGIKQEKDNASTQDTTGLSNTGFFWYTFLHEG